MDTLELSENKFLHELFNISSVEEVNLRNQKNIYFGLRSASLLFGLWSHSHSKGHKLKKKNTL